MLSTITSVYIGITIYYTIQKIKTSFKNKTVEEDLEHNWKKLKENLYYIKCDLLRKEYKKKKGS